ncbi:A disintegrin and metalloproteinase with thrombospondin motifs 9-like [Corticium candelabrum]|uniref:A disintegrin and metalloproteinase with thrombospondin motifs 9-like n=1 Tax=Corticium candelabrum TaxID=121492 RepID=UPI002E25F006|nr:A disintegrin and metalloproteinase with thrombospondin motifs 9-like [Corticium candelabrum]
MVMTCILETLLVFVACQLTTVAVQGEEEGASYIWKTGEFSACSQTCDGQRERRVVCQGRKSDGSTFDANLEDCNPQVKPVSTKSCGSECPEYGWLKEKYGKCDATCSTNDGKGNRTRRVWCSKKVGTHRKVTKDEHCIIALRHPKPPSRKSCHVKCSVIVGTCR